ncbi:hypothetical protein ScPMuIL_005296 [Solemya velum]
MGVREKKGTILPAGESFNAKEASKKLRRAMKGLGTDEDGIIDVLTGYCNTELQQIREEYKILYERCLHEDLSDELGGHFGKLVSYILMKREVFDAFCLRHAIEGTGTNEITLIELLSSRNNKQLKAIKLEYKRVFKKDLESDIINDTSGYFRKLLVDLAAADRDENEQIEAGLVREDAKALYKAGEAMFGTDESKFIEILGNRSVPHLHGVFDEYKKINPKGIEEAIISETSGDFQKGLLSVVTFVTDPLSYFATCFHETLDGPGTDDERLIQLVVSHCEVDLQNVKEVYEKKYHKSLVRAIEEDTSGDYRRLLVRLVDPEDSDKEVSKP